MDPALRVSDHLRCAQMLEQAYGDTMPMALIPVVARHYAEAGNVARAAQYYLQAGLALTEQNMNTSAREQLERARALFAHAGGPWNAGRNRLSAGLDALQAGRVRPGQARHAAGAGGLRPGRAAADGRTGAGTQARRDRAALLLGVIPAVGEQHYDEAVPHLQAVITAPTTGPRPGADHARLLPVPQRS